MGLDLDAILDMPLGYSQSNGTVALREQLAAIYPGATPDQSRSPTEHPKPTTCSPSACCAMATRSPSRSPITCSSGACRKSLGAQVNCFRLRIDRKLGARLGRVRARRQREDPPGLRLESEQPERRRALRDAMRRIVARCEAGGAYLLADEVTRAPKSIATRTPSFWGMSDRVIVTSGLSKAYGIPGVRIGWIVGPEGRDRGVLDAARLSHHRAEQDLRRRGARRGAGRPIARSLCPHPRHPATESAGRCATGPASFGGFLTFREPQAGALCLMRYQSPTPSFELCERSASTRAC